MVLTFARTTELRAARWPEFENLDGKEPVWRIPAERTKMKRDHLVPLAPQAVAVLRELRERPDSDTSLFLFSSASLGKCNPCSPGFQAAAVDQALRRESDGRANRPGHHACIADYTISRR
jgi:integrase